MSFHAVVVDCKIYIHGRGLIQMRLGEGRDGEKGNLFSLLGIGLKGYHSAPSGRRTRATLLWATKSAFPLWQVKRWPPVLVRKRMKLPSQRRDKMPGRDIWPKAK